MRLMKKNQRDSIKHKFWSDTSYLQTCRCMTLIYLYLMTLINYFKKLMARSIIEFIWFIW